MENEYIFDCVISDRDFKNDSLKKGEYENCKFQNCDFSHSDLSEIKFIDS